MTQDHSQRHKRSISKVTQKYQATIPQAVREALDIHQIPYNNYSNCFER